MGLNLLLGGKNARVGNPKLDDLIWITDIGDWKPPRGRGSDETDTGLADVWQGPSAQLQQPA
jgi:hypothetical protein